MTELVSAGGERKRLIAPLFFSGAALLLMLAWVRPIDHDEGQYVAAVALTPRLLPYRDFLYLQTPLYPLLFGPLAPLFAGHLWEALRGSNALMAAATLWLVFRAQRELGVPERIALAATALLAACDAFLFGAATARNDMLPAMLAAAAIWMLLRRYSFAAGLFMSAAMASKISYALPLAALLPVLILDLRAGSPRLNARWVAAGAIVAALPMAILAWLSPEGFAFGVLHFPAKAPSLWYEATGRGWKIGLAAKALDTLKFLALGPAIAALWIVGRRMCRSRSGELRPLFLDLFVLAGLLAALLPTPTWRQYLVPLLPPLFIRLGMIMGEERLPRPVSIALGLTAMAGLGPSLLALGAAASAGTSPVAQATSAAHRIGEAVRASGIKGAAAGPSPNYWADSGLPIDPRFAAGPFLLRTNRLLPANEERALHVVSLDNYQAELRRHPPALLITGAEPARLPSGDTLDGRLERFGSENGYRRIAVPNSSLTLYLRIRPPMSRPSKPGMEPDPNTARPQRRDLIAESDADRIAEGKAVAHGL